MQFDERWVAGLLTNILKTRTIYTERSAGGGEKVLVFGPQDGLESIIAKVATSNWMDRGLALVASPASTPGALIQPDEQALRYIEKLLHTGPDAPRFLASGGWVVPDPAVYRRHVIILVDPDSSFATFLCVSAPGDPIELREPQLPDGISGLWLVSMDQPITGTPVLYWVSGSGWKFARGPIPFDLEAHQ